MESGEVQALFRTVRSAPGPKRKTLLCALPSETQAGLGLRVTKQQQQQLQQVVQGLSRHMRNLGPCGDSWSEALIVPHLAITILTECIQVVTFRK